MKHLLFGFLVMITLSISSISYADPRLDKCEPYRDLIESILKEEGVSTDYFYLAVCESTCKIKESNKGARGFFQLMPRTFSIYKDESCKNIDDIKCNTIAAARYIKHLQERFHKMSYLIKAYNRGGHNLVKNGSTREADNLSACVMRYVNSK